MLHPPRLMSGRATELTFSWEAPVDARAVEYYELEYREDASQVRIESVIIKHN